MVDETACWRTVCACLRLHYTRRREPIALDEPYFSIPCHGTAAHVARAVVRALDNDNHLMCA